MIFNYGGFTFEEARDISKMSTPELQIILGGTCLHNSKRYFINEVVLLLKSLR